MSDQIITQSKNLSNIELLNRDHLVIRQKKELLEVFTGFETGNKYEIYDTDNNQIGYIAEKSSGFWSYFKKWFFGRNRPFTVYVYDKRGSVILELTRPFHFFFSTVSVFDHSKKQIGAVQRRFRLFGKKYDLSCGTQIFAHIKAQFWRIYKFPITNIDGAPAGSVVKKWRGMNLGGILTEVFTDADTFLVDFTDGNWGHSQKLIILATAISIDFDYFENNND